jgi:hypothetical protein
MILESRGGWTEAVVYLVLVRGLFVQTILRYLEQYAYNEAERFIYGNVMQDKARLLTYGLDHLKFAIAHNEDQKQIITTLLAIGDGLFIRDFNDPVLREALAIIFGGSIDGARGAGMDVYHDMMRAYISTHLEYCQWLDVPRRVPEPLEQYAPQD